MKRDCFFGNFEAGETLSESFGRSQRSADKLIFPTQGEALRAFLEEVHNQEIDSTDPPFGWSQDRLKSLVGRAREN